MTSDGVGLLCSMLEYWGRQEKSPKVLACTHFSELFSVGLMDRCPAIQYQTMQVMTTDRCSSEDDNQRHVLLYKLIPGHATSSYGVRLM